MRRWYGQQQLSADGGPQPENDPEEEEQVDNEGDAVLVLDGDSPIGEQVVLQLILRRCDRQLCSGHPEPPADAPLRFDYRWLPKGMVMAHDNRASYY